MTPAIEKVDTNFAGFFRHRQVGDKLLLTNQAGQYVLLAEDEFKQFVEGTVVADSELYGRLNDANLVRADADIADMATRTQKRNSFLAWGPNLHICGVAEAGDGGLMSAETATQLVELAFNSTSPWMTFEFRGGEPLANWDVVTHVIDEAAKQGDADKEIAFRLVSNLALLDDDKVAYLVEKKVDVVAVATGADALPTGVSLDGDADALLRAGIKKLHEAYAAAGDEDRSVEVLLRGDTGDALVAAIDEFAKLGCKVISVEPNGPFSLTGTLAQEGSAAAFVSAYGQAFDHIIGLNGAGTAVREPNAAILLTKILVGEEPNFLDGRNPLRTAIAAWAYGADGTIFTSADGRAIGAGGDDFFQIGKLGESEYEALVGHEVTKAATMAAIPEANPDCVNCAYLPFCGVSPEYNYATQGSLSGRMRDSNWCAARKGLQDLVFTKLAEADPEVQGLFESWAQI